MRSLILLPVFLAACAHTNPDEMTSTEHRLEAAKHQRAAEDERAKFKNNDTRPVVAPRTPFVDDGPRLEQYNPSAEHLNSADRELRRAFEHLHAAQDLEKYEDLACAGISLAERTACPLLAPFTERVEETGQGLRLNLKASAPAKTLAAQMQCHLAFARSRGFDRAPCPLYVKGVEIARNEQTIEVRSQDPRVASEVRLQGRKLFGQPVVEK